MSDFVFAYGTLRRGEHNEGLWPKKVISRPAQAKGILYYAPGTQGYPVLKADDHNLVAGDLYEVNLDAPLVQSIIAMELGAGYNLQWTLAYCVGSPEPIECLAFYWPWAQVGERINSNDWRTGSKWEGATQCEGCYDYFPTALLVSSDDGKAYCGDCHPTLSMGWVARRCHGCELDFHPDELRNLMGYDLCATCYPTDGNEFTALTNLNR